MIDAIRREIRRRRGTHHPSPWEFLVEAEQVPAATQEHSELSRLFFAHEGRLAFKWTHYLPAYEEQFGPYRAGFPLSDGGQRRLMLLEIGISQGGSLQLWNEYFAAGTGIWGIDIDPRCAAVADEENGISVRIGSQADDSFLRSVVAEMGGVDIVVDDGSHNAADQLASFRALFPVLSEGGLYVVEDLHTSYWQRFGGGLRRKGTFVEYSKHLIDEMHRWYHGGGSRPPEWPASMVDRISFYDSMAFIRKRTRGRPEVARVGERSF